MVRNVFIAFKSCAFMYQSGLTSWKYHITFKRWNIFEIWFMGLATIKILVLLPNIYYREINWLFACLILNSGLSYWLSFLFHIRSCVALQKPMKSVRKYQAWFGLKMFLLVCIYLLSPLFTLDAAKKSYHFDHKSLSFQRYPFLMDCRGLVYRKYL